MGACNVCRNSFACDLLRRGIEKDALNISVGRKGRTPENLDL